MAVGGWLPHLRTLLTSETELPPVSELMVLCWTSLTSVSCMAAGELAAKETSKVSAGEDFAKAVALNLYHYMVSPEPSYFKPSGC